MTATAGTADAPATRERAPDAPPAGDGTREVELAIEGMTCAACAVRIEKKLNRLADVRASVNYATATARVTVPTAMPVGDLLAAVERAGYTAAAPSSEMAEAGLCQQEKAVRPGPRALQTSGPLPGDTAYLRRRLIVALVLFIPLTDLSLMLSLVPSLRFPGWQWLLVACAAPVALWCAWPFHRAALKNAGTARRRWTRWCRSGSSRPAAGRSTPCSCSTAAAAADRCGSG